MALSGVVSALLHTHPRLAKRGKRVRRVIVPAETILFTTPLPATLTRRKNGSISSRFFSHHLVKTGVIQALAAFSTGLAYMARQMALCSSGTSD